MYIVLVILIGIVVGMLINYFSDVLPRFRKVALPVCGNCEAKFNIKDYLLFQRCKSCGQKFPARNIIVIIVALLISIIAYYFPMSYSDGTQVLQLTYWATLPMFLFLGVILVIDIEHRAVLIETCYFGLVLFFIYGLVIHMILITLIGGAAGFLIMLGLYYFGILFNKIMGKIRKTEIDEVALGFGDVYVSTFLGLLVGWPVVIGMLLMGIIASGIFSFFYMLIHAITRKYTPFSAIPYAPFLIVAAIATFYLKFS